MLFRYFEEPSVIVLLCVRYVPRKSMSLSKRKGMPVYMSAPLTNSQIIISSQTASQKTCSAGPVTRASCPRWPLFQTTRPESCVSRL